MTDKKVIIPAAKIVPEELQKLIIEDPEDGFRYIS